MSRDQRAGGPLLGRATKGIGSLIGISREAYAHHKAKSAQQEEGREQVSDSNDHGVDNEHTEQLDEEAWALDEASTELAPNIQQRHQITLLETPGLELPITTLQPLQYPVILPQRRPQTKDRGFVRAYAPLLGECKGIDEATFLKFIDEFYDSTQTSQYIQAVNVAGNIVGMVPSVITMSIAMASNAATKTATSVQGRYKTNTYLDAINAKLFNPRNLHAVVMTYKPTSSQEIVDIDMSASTTDAALAKSLAHGSKMGKMSNSAGTSRGEPSIPHAAPLIYPTIDHAVATNDQNTPSPKQESTIKRSSAFIKSYLDRRAAAEYAGTYGEDSKLATPGAAADQHFVSRYSDPNHPANSGSIVALLTGGAVDPRAKLLGRRAEMHAKIQRQPGGLSEQERRNVEMGRGTGQSKGPIRGLLRKVVAEDVLYLLIAEIPRTMDAGR